MTKRGKRSALSMPTASLSPLGTRRTVSIETPDGRMAAEADDWIVKHPEGFFHLYTSEGFAANFEPA